MPTEVEIIEAGERFGVGSTVAALAASNITSGAVTLLGFSGKLASGKDSVAAGVVSNLGLTETLHLSFAHALKEEVDETLRFAREGRIDVIMETMHLTDRDAVGQYVALVRAALDEQPDVDARTRTPGIRRVLQFWGTEIRRAQQFDYWVCKAAVEAMTAAANGRHVFYTDGRFPNEISASQQLGFLVVRLEVSPEVQAMRLAQRDGLRPDPASLIHPSEIALDDYRGFDLVTSNEGSFDATVGYVSEWVRSQRS
jgi:hypothetical protein